MILELAWRNLWRHTRRTLLSVIAITATGGLTVFLPSLQAGSYQAMIVASSSVLDGFLQIQHPDYLDKPAMRNSFTPPPALVRALDSGGFTAPQRGVGFALISSDARSIGAQIVGVEPELEREISSLPGNIRSGRYLQQEDEIVMGQVLARNLGVELGQRVTLLGTGHDGSLAVDSLQLVGVFETGFPALDRQLAEMQLERFDQSFGMAGQRHGIILHPPAEIDQPALSALLEQYQLVLRDWRTLQPGLLHAIQLDISSAVVMYAVLVLVVCFSLMNAMLMSVLERSREYGMVMALGVSPQRLGRILWLENLMIALMGVVTGAVAGALVTLWYEQAGIHFSGAEEVFARYGLSSTVYPMLTPLTLLLGPGTILLVLMLAGFYPVMRVRRLNLLAAMRAV